MMSGRNQARKITGSTAMDQTHERLYITIIALLALSVVALGAVLIVFLARG